ncbi:MAG: hypothetical protein ABTQ26_00325 [Azonexus sp.]
MPRHTPQQQFKEAKQIAKDHGCFVIEKAGRYLVYRKTPMRAVYLGARSTPETLRAFVCKVTDFH